MPMFGGGGGGGQSTDDQSIYLFWGIIAVIAAALIFWWLEKPMIVHFFFWLRGMELEMALPFVHLIYWITSFLHLPSPDYYQLYKWKYFMQSATAANVTWDDLSKLNADVGRVLLFPMVLVGGGFAVYLYKFHRLAHYVHIYSMKSLRKMEVRNWPQIKPIIDTDLIKTPLTKGEWASAASPIEFCKQHNLLLQPTEENDVAWHVRKQQSVRLFAMQMGSLLPDSLFDLPIHLQALVVVFVSRTHGDDKYSLDLLRSIAASSGSGKLNFEGVHEKLKSFENSELIKWMRKRHAYVATFVAGLLEASRATGVLASSEFLWLKPLDRRMWYMLNGVGRRVAYTEISGPYAHWLAEKRFKRALPVPMVQAAAEALELFIRNVKFIPKGDVWHSKEG